MDVGFTRSCDTKRWGLGKRAEALNMSGPRGHTGRETGHRSLLLRLNGRASVYARSAQVPLVARFAVIEIHASYDSNFAPSLGELRDAIHAKL